MSMLCMLSVLGNVYVLNLHHTDVRLHKPMSKWVSILH